MDELNSESLECARDEIWITAAVSDRQSSISGVHPEGFAEPLLAPAMLK
jgi:hypothetical protein